MLLPVSMPFSEDEEESSEIDEKMKDLKKMIYNSVSSCLRQKQQNFYELSSL